MLCPTCKKGTLRVIVYIACGCGHHPLVCDDCLAIFDVDHSDPLGPLKLPPEHDIHPSTELDAARKADTSVSDEEFRDAISTLPTIDEFKEVCEILEGNPDAFSDEEEEGDEDEGPN